MNNSAEKVSPPLGDAYDAQYSGQITPWRELCGRYKAENIEAVCLGRRFARVLDCGAGEGSVLAMLDSSGFCDDLSAIDISSSGIAAVKSRRLTTLREATVFDGYKIPFEDNHFDMAYCSHVIEHVEHPLILLRELSRVAEYQVFEVPLDYSADVDSHSEHYHSYGHINVYSPSTFRFLLRSEGFEVLTERHTRISAEVIRYNWYKNMKMLSNIRGELKLFLWPIYRALRILQLGRTLYRELEYSAYTCLTRRGVGLRIF